MINTQITLFYSYLHFTAHYFTQYIFLYLHLHFAHFAVYNFTTLLHILNFTQSLDSYTYFTFIYLCTTLIHLFYGNYYAPYSEIHTTYVYITTIHILLLNSFRMSKYSLSHITSKYFQITHGKYKTRLSGHFRNKYGIKSVSLK